MSSLIEWIIALIMLMAILVYAPKVCDQVRASVPHQVTVWIEKAR